MDKNSNTNQQQRKLLFILFKAIVSAAAELGKAFEIQNPILKQTMLVSLTAMILVLFVVAPVQGQAQHNQTNQTTIKTLGEWLFSIHESI